LKAKNPIHVNFLTTIIPQQSVGSLNLEKIDQHPENQQNSSRTVYFAEFFMFQIKIGFICVNRESIL